MYYSTLGGFFLSIECRLKLSICETRINLCQHHAQISVEYLSVSLSPKLKKEEGKGTFFDFTLRSIREGPPAMWRPAP